MKKDYNMGSTPLFFLSTLVFAAILVKFSVYASSGYCPEYCKCDIYEGRNRADCSGQRLINAYVGLSAGVEVLDLSYNDIAIIDETCFKQYTYLINLTITHNDVHTIFLDAFVTLGRLRIVDLAYNRLEYIDERLFESNHHLQQLNLEGNKFMSLPNGPLLRSKSLLTLNLRNCGINYVPVELFTGLPRLIELDLSQNLMITLSTAPFNAPKRLRLLQLDENTWNCDSVLVKALSIMRHRGINVTIAECDAAYNEWQQLLPLRSQSHAFERIQLAPTPTDVNVTNKTTVERNTTLNWRNLPGENESNDDDDNDDNDDDIADFANYIDDKQTPEMRLNLLGIKVDEKLCEGAPENLCRRYRNCLEQVSHILINQLHTSKVENLIYTQNDLNFAFLLGIAIGITGVVFLITFALCFKSCFDIKHFKRRNDIEEAAYNTVTPAQNHIANHTPQDVQSLQVEAPTVPPPIRRPRRARRPQGPNMEYAVVHRPPGSDSFISRLLGRPARHRYYRAGTATLIRCLSRTSLFNNTNLQRDSSNPTTPEINTTESTPLRVERPETPPPEYGDIIDKKLRPS